MFNFYVCDFLSLFRAITLSTKLGCPTSDPAELETCLQKVQASALLTTQFEVMTSITIGSFPFLPVVDGIFLPDTPDVCACYICKKFTRIEIM